MEMTLRASSTALEPAVLLEGFLAHPPLGFEASRLPSGLPTFRAPLDLTTTMDDALRSTLLGLPLSPGQINSSCLIGTGAGDQARAVRWDTAFGIATNWVLTFPAAAVLAYLGVKFAG